MDSYFPVTKSASSTSSKNEKPTKRDEKRYQPYILRGSAKDASKPKSEQEPSAAAVNKFLLSTLSNSSNPITHSDSADNAIYVFSTATGHQVSEGRTNRRLCLEDRARKIKAQTTGEATREQPPKVLANVRCYINGFLAGTTDLEMKRLVISAGGVILPTASSATHILTSQHLSGSKTDHILKSKSRSRVPFVVKPEWVKDSIAAGKRRSEREYLVIKNAGTKNLIDMLQK
ncbi:hypothetical protein DFH07DRAFT_811153 [Mycena maculata]|uniref:BRCT domain-containing protein n=1 Tax=Mycena maculata TaxID=230809 RepID=A0AAD7JK80_9AGAR|nr:hypothetical protein DFH07DRAFT_811153 [Mycena maculata]